ncbi:MAG: dihydrolipoamide acetyltransferase family protein [Acidimicrobiales bacterium]
MARYEFKLPDVGEGVTEGEIVGWLVRPGDVVLDDQPVVEVMTDKATVTITAPKAGVVVETRGRIGEIVKVHSVLVVFDLGDDPVHAAHPHGAGAPAKADDESPALAVGHIEDALPVMNPPAPRRGGAEAAAPYFNEKPLATPATRKLARDRDVDLRRVPPTGPSARVTRRDVESFSPAMPSLERVPASAPLGARSPSERDPSREERVPLVGLRRKIAQKMARSVTTAAHFTFVEECDVSALKSLRARLITAASEKGVKLSFLPFVVKAVVSALKTYPILGTTLDEETNEIVFHHRYDIGIATATEAGLIVPVVKSAEKRSLLGIAQEIERLSEDARSGRVKIEDLHGSTFTITSLGAQGGLFATPIINFPEVAILGVHQMKTKPVVRGGQIVIGDVMLLSLSFDHRVVDGHVGAAFAYEIIEALENPERMFLEMA